MSNKKKSFLLHIDSLDILEDLDDQQVGLLFRAIKSYQKDEPTQLDGMVKIAFSPFKNQFIRDNVKYTETCERRAIAGAKGGNQKVANASKCKQTLVNVADSKSVSKSDSDNKSKEMKNITSRFTPPTDIETVAYFESKGSTNVEAQKFWLFYDSKDWKVGKNKMQKWKSSASGWITRNKTEANRTDILAASSASNWHEEDLGL